ncbi:MAG: alpha/beta hydrolase [Bdellovibrionales bacterium]|nr:alpha/beta hydrolase [Bdellovibrionales bacterium]
MQHFFKIISAVFIALSLQAANAFEWTPFKTVSLPSFPHIEVPIYKSPGKKGPGILFIHGNSSSSRSFVRQKVSALGLTHKLYFMDLPGFGQASKVNPSLPFPVDQNGVPVGFAEYQLGMIEAIVRVANDPAVNAQVLVGWSLGGDLALLAQGTGLLPNTKGIMMFGTAPVGADAPAVPPFKGPNVPLPFPLGILPSFGFSFRLTGTPPLGFDFLGEFTDPIPSYAPAPISDSVDQGEAYIRAFFKNSRRLNGPIPPFFIEDGYARADARARGSIGVVAFNLLPPGPIALPDELDVLKNLNFPVAILHGKEDAFVNLDYLEALEQNDFLPTLWHNKIVKVKKAGHAVQFERPRVFNTLVKKFLKDI